MQSKQCILVLLWFKKATNSHLVEKDQVMNIIQPIIEGNKSNIPSDIKNVVTA